MVQLRMLVCFAHPDDEAFPVGGTLATYAEKGVDIRLICATLGDEGEIRQEGSATVETLAQVRRQELQCSCESLGIQEPIILDYRDSGMARTEANNHPRAFMNTPAAEVVPTLVKEMRRFQPQVVLTFGPDGLYGHPDHIAIHHHTVTAFQQAGDPMAFPEQLQNGLKPHSPPKLFYSVRPRGFRTVMALKLREAGMDAPLPSPARVNDGVPPELIHIEVDATDVVERKIKCLQCHHTQNSPQRPYHLLPREVAADIIGREHFTRGYPTVAPGERVPADLFEGLW